MERENKPIPMLERWKNDIPKGKTVGYHKISNEERIKARKNTLALKVKQGRITEEQANRSLESLYEELGILVAK